MVFAGLYPVESHQYAELREALEKLRLNDASFFFEPETSAGARLRIPLRLPGTAPHGNRAGAARARVQHGSGDDGAGRALPRRRRPTGRCSRSTARRSCPRPTSQRIEEPIITAMMLTPSEHVGGILQLCQEKRGVQKSLEYREREPRARHLRAAVQRSRARLLRQAQDAVPRLRVARLSCNRLLGVAAREDGHPRQRRSGRRAVGHRAPRQRLRSADGRWRRRCAS